MFTNSMDTYALAIYLTKQLLLIFREILPFIYCMHMLEFVQSSGNPEKI